MTYQTSSQSSEKTGQLAAEIGARLRGGEVIVLTSDLGGGKTAFVRGLARGMGSADHVASPTFTISREYKAPAKGLTLYHFDFYRLQEPGLIAHELAETIDDPEAVIAIEWGQIVEDVLPEQQMAVEIVRTGESTRQFTFNYPSELAYLLPEGMPC
ncbi:MAG TPA: tRNA (adenosine(37)-N6)-threonylcarbamoyltransferase complex ATPase subunit type 1 TsaE [Candidatus Saccharimonadales bacterium]